ncbi:MAG: DUF3800 domain-containing protein [Anaerolineae bacterium]|jgi:hypothetical protein|nr:DUF3800 domain-containing protein [Anaerolineae bacterium]
MNILYLDDSGSQTNPKEDFFILGGISVPENSVRWLTYELEKIAMKFNKDDPGAVELHAAEIFRGHEYPWKNIKSKEDRIDIIKSVLHSVDGANRDIVAFACAVEKKYFPREDLVMRAYEELSSRYDLYLQNLSDTTKQTERGIIVIDDTSSETGLINLAHNITRTGNRWGRQTRGIIEVPLFIDSRASRLMQLADHIAYATFRRYNAKDLNYFDIIEPRFDEQNGVICGLTHLNANHRTCTCSACLSRRVAASAEENK